MKQGKDGWLELDTSASGDMDATAQREYSEYKQAYRMAQEAKARYEQAMLTQFRNAGLTENKALVFGYNFGKASVKIVNASEVRKQAKAQAPATQSLADFLANQR